MKMRVLVHGAENFIGRRLCSALRRSDWAEPVAVTTGDRPGLRSQAATSGAFVHCITGGAAAIAAHARDFYRLISDLRVQARVVHLSSMTVYGSARGRIDEHARLAADLGAYSRAQLAAEGYARAHHNSVILRPGAEYGPGCVAWSIRIARLLRAHRLGDLGAAGDGICNLVYIDDLVDVIQAASRVDGIAGEAFNVTMEQKPTWNEYFEQFALALRAVPIRRVGARRLRIETRLLAPPLKLAEIAARALRLPHPPPPLPASLLQLCAQDVELSSAKAMRVLGAVWTPLEDGLRQAAASSR
jgi:nucleoside-diphosphate-sugar epimerase